ncbi:sigma-70 family RNA polymerase sigma factor [candidate division KSB1 bacterium]|nr:sigma-70 family RNA polymerase sigma factor [candidate division KSB1 bacterium]NIR72637.1 sigma-70 family RNA polymerase sigma factor [candidate division KSB1 bacterium]NIS27348.1 sigma-70 family RNA polymerase sigma factor [candidate division KSB1 bacterium]NIU25409.1 sigma-70 family RNA polymerase sigma factor [candidate division KSB1 bacterium]NIU90010.1 sigma-70 family RNA polymerase sigma factor [candidate division KSB1 bacterium]
MDQEEQARIKEAQRGNILAFESLVKKYDRQVLQLAYSFVKNTQDAQDIYQEVFVRVYKNLKRFQFKSEFSTWLYRVVVNYCINFNKRKRRAKYFSIDADTNSEEESWKITLKGEELSPEKTVLNEELNNEINSAVEQLSDQQKTVFILRHDHGHKIKEIAKIMKCSEGTVKNYLFRATQRMQVLLKPYAKIAENQR